MVPVPFCAYCGENDLAGGSQWVNIHSLLKVPVNLCSACYAQMAERLGFNQPSGRLPLRVRLIERFGAGGCCLILVPLFFLRCRFDCRSLSSKIVIPCLEATDNELDSDLQNREWPECVVY